MIPFKVCLSVYLFARRPRGKLLKCDNVPRVCFKSDSLGEFSHYRLCSYKTLFISRDFCTRRVAISSASLSEKMC